MRKLNLRNYTNKFKVPDQMNPGGEIEVEFPYHVKNTVLTMMFIPELKLSGAEVVKQNVLAMKIEQYKGDEILLEEEEWERIKRAFDTFRGFSRADVELIERINNAEIMEINQKPTPKAKRKAEAN